MSKPSKHKRKATVRAADAADPETAKRPPVRGWLLAGLSCLLVAQLLLPADGTMAASGAGVPLTMLWLLLVVIWLITMIYRGRQPLNVSVTDWAVLVLIVLHSISALWAVGHAPRPAINMLWEWIAVGCCFLLVRQLVTRSRECRVLLVVFVALASGMSAYGYYQALIEIPATQRAYEAGPENRIKEALGIDPSATVDPFAKQQFESRLYTQRPTGTFLLANSFAGFLVPWLVICFGIAWSSGRAAARQSIVFCVAVICCLLMIGVLYLTHSRTAGVAAMCGLGLFVGWRLCADKYARRTRMVVALVALFAVATVMFIVLRVEHPAVAAARRSVQYRFEYWQATAAMIADQPWLGCGPGNFRDRYTAYKLPVALEEVADPHNFLLEIWATAGAPAMIALAVVLVGFFLNSISRREREEDHPADTDDEPPTDKYLLGGAAAGILLAIVMNRVYAAILNDSLELTALAVFVGGAAASVAGLWPWVRRGRVEAAFVPIAVAAMLINLSAAGGIGNHGVACSLWILVAIGLNLNTAAARCWVPSRVQAGVAIIAALVIAVACQRMGYHPVIRSETALLASRSAAARGNGDAELEQIRVAVAADPLAAGPPRRLARLLYSHWLARLAQDDPLSREIGERLEQHFRTASRAWLDRTPDSATAYQEVGDMYLRAFRANNDASLLEDAVRSYREAVERYPNSGILRAHLAWTHSLSGDTAAAADQASRAIELDDIQPHADVRLDHDFQRLSDPAAGDSNTRMLMERLADSRSIDGHPARTIE